MKWEIGHLFQNLTYCVFFIPLVSLTLLFSGIAVCFAGMAYVTAKFAGISDDGEDVHAAND